MRQSKFPLHFMSTGKLLVIEVTYLFVDIFIYLFVCLCKPPFQHPVRLVLVEVCNFT